MSSVNPNMRITDDHFDASPAVVASQPPVLPEPQETTSSDTIAGVAGLSRRCKTLSKEFGSTGSLQGSLGDLPSIAASTIAAPQVVASVGSTAPGAGQSGPANMPQGSPLTAQSVFDEAKGSTLSETLAKIAEERERKGLPTTFGSTGSLVGSFGGQVVASVGNTAPGAGQSGPANMPQGSPLTAQSVFDEAKGSTLSETLAKIAEERRRKGFCR